MSYIIAIAGGSCSGKTTLAHHLQNRFGEENSLLVRQDDYYHDIRDRAKGDEIPNFDIPEALDFGLLAQNLTDFKHDNAVSLPTYDFTTHQRQTATAPFSARRFTIVEGILLLNDPSIRQIADKTIYMKCPAELRFSRRLSRDVAERGRTEEFVHHQFANDVEPAHLKYVAPSAEFADVVIAQDKYMLNLEAVLDDIIAHLPSLTPSKVGAVL
ncbi:MAG: uridine kinase [Maricaulaceae bacterium]